MDSVILHDVIQLENSIHLLFLFIYLFFVKGKFLLYYAATVIMYAAQGLTV